ncbi:hypothetical protein EX895_000315 [Sporisorium graminicola]|uniref:Uncharacterized protein n=1 Tax=Sporisorium graminicola TaxID=280036 RepID=A0A4U7L0W2_9BASI|nr:hypothetical protein EX895_000315 [Sporisorium graminicola]TKY90317.1 hypothetical protein EX895_000315 [Sporisorium graminicola]
MSTTNSMAAAGSTSTHPSIASSAPSTSKNQLYSLASRVPLIKSPSVSLPKPIKLPPDLHPLPADISAYFVYPFSLESYVLDPNTPSSATVDQLLAKHQQYLEARQRQKEDQQREMLRRVAPGWHGDVLLPTTSNSGAAMREAQPMDASAAAVVAGPKDPQQAEPLPQERTPLDDLADHLAQLDALNASGAPPSSHQYH